MPCPEEGPRSGQAGCGAAWLREPAIAVRGQLAGPSIGRAPLPSLWREDSLSCGKLPKYADCGQSAVSQPCFSPSLGSGRPASCTFGSYGAARSCPAAGQALSL